MSTPEHCHAQAQEAEQLASLVSYGQDRERLTTQAQAWRDKAAALEAQAAAAAVEAAPRPSLVDRVRQGWDRLSR